MPSMVQSWEKRRSEAVWADIDKWNRIECQPVTRSLSNNPGGSFPGVKQKEPNRKAPAAIILTRAPSQLGRNFQFFSFAVKQTK